ncbi:hypothetical protein NLY39_05780 [Pseudomonas sp. KHPS1]|nr:hypothetical protein [Pseudomonas sp. KHPS1]UTH37665.1 hypothetical protein NLY39_05780 [Pseudomonas sp. KHPS1]
MELFRAIPFSQLAAAEKGLRRHATMRIPSNVPYVVDNLWESIRPKNMPSRRHAIYASPTPELALQNASAPLADGEEYVACRVVVEQQKIRIAQLQVTDARYHSDIRLISKWISQHGQELAELSLEQKQKLAPLFMPGLHRRELTELWNTHPLVAALCAYVGQHSSFWSSASDTPQSSDGELFFELIDDADTYRLEAI